MFGAQAFAFRRWLLVWATGELQAERSVRRYRVAAGMAHGTLVCESEFGVWHGVASVCALGLGT